MSQGLQNKETLSIHNLVDQTHKTNDYKKRTPAPSMTGVNFVYRFQIKMKEIIFEKIWKQSLISNIRVS